MAKTQKLAGCAQGNDAAERHWLTGAYSPRRWLSLSVDRYRRGSARSALKVRQQGGPVSSQLSGVPLELDGAIASHTILCHLRGCLHLPALQLLCLA